MKTYQRTFPILCLLKDKEYNSLEIIQEDIFDGGTGFFISENGDFMSVGHNFHREEAKKYFHETNQNKLQVERVKKILGKEKDFKTYEVADFYALLSVKGTNDFELKKIDFNTVQVKYINPIPLSPDGEKRSIDFYEGQDIAIGKIDLEGDKVQNPIKVEFGREITEDKTLSIEGYLWGKHIKEGNDNIVVKKIEVGNIPFYYHELKNRRLQLKNRRLHDIGKHILRIDDGKQTFERKGVSFEGKNGYAGLSGSPVFDKDNYLVGIFYGGEDENESHAALTSNTSAEHEDENDFDNEPMPLPDNIFVSCTNFSTHQILTLVSCKNPHLKKIYDTHFGK